MDQHTSGSRWRRALAGLAVVAMVAPVALVAQAHPASAEVPTPAYVRSIGGQGRPGVFAWGVQFNPVTNEILVADYLHFQIRRYDLQGNHLGDFWRDDAFGQPYTIGVDPSDGAIYVAELKDNPITTGIAKYDRFGNFMYEARGALSTAPNRRIITDAVTTSGSTTLTSATARFSSTFDVGASLEGAGIPAGATVASRTNSSTVVMSHAATATATGVSVEINPFPTPAATSFRAFYTVWLTVEEDTGDIFVLDSHYQNYVGERPRVLQLRFDDATQLVTNVDAWVAVPDGTPFPDNGDEVQDPGECTNPVGCDPRMYGIDIVTSDGPTNDMIYVTDAYNRRAYRFHKDEQRTLADGSPSHYIDTFGAGQMGGDQRGIVVNEALNTLYSVDAENSQVDQFTMGTATTPPTFVRSFGSEGNEPGQFAGGGRAIDVDADGNVWVADFGGFETEKFGPTGTPLLTAPTPARKPPGGLLGQPRDVAVDDATGDVWVADAWNQRFQRFSGTGVPLGVWGERGPGGPFDMNYPRHIAIQPANTASEPGPDHPKRIWLSQERGHHVQVYNYPTTQGGSPTYVAQVGLIGRDDIEPGHFRWPVDFEFFTHSNGTEIVVIGDRMANSVKFFNAVTFQEILNPNDTDPSNGAPMIARPNHGTAVDAATNHVYVVNPSNDRIEVYDEDGDPVNNWVNGSGTPVNYFGSQGTGSGQLQDPVDATIGGGYLYVSDEALSRVTIFGLDGTYQGRFGSTYGSNIYDFKGPVGIDIGANGLLYVTDSYNDRIQVFDTNASRQYETTAPAPPVVSAPSQQASVPLAPVDFAGTATDNVAVGQVEAAIQDADSGLWWNAGNESWEADQTWALTAWSGANATNVNWRWTFNGVSAQGRYIALFKTRDHNANQSSPVVVRTFAMPGATPPVPPPPPVIDTTRPAGTQTFPTSGQVLPRAPITFTGTATDDVGVASVRIAIKRVSDGRWLSNPTSSSSNAFPSSGFTWFTATLDSPDGTSTGWSWEWPSPSSAGGDFQTLVEVRDAAGNISANKPQVPFTTTTVLPDGVAPDTTLGAPTPGSSFPSGPVAISGAATDAQGVTRVDLSIQRTDTGAYWTGSGWSATATSVPASLGAPGTPSTTWSYSFGPGVGASFTVAAAAVDISANVDLSPATTDFSITSGPPVDTQDPDAQVTTPTDGQAFTTSPIALSGSASDDAGVATVRVGIRDTGTLQWWNGSAWVGGYSTVDAVLASPGAPSTAWSLDWAPTGSGAYAMLVAAVDTAGKVDPSKPWIRFSHTTGTADVAAPDGLVSSPTNGQAFSTSPVTFAGTATDDVAVAAVRVAIRDTSALRWWNGSGWQAQYVTSEAVLASPGAPSTAWSLAWAPTGSGAYAIQVIAVDAVGKVDPTKPWVPFSHTTGAVDTANPNATVSTPTNGQSLPGSPVTFAGSATDDVAVATVRVAIRNTSTLQWWGGSAWQTLYATTDAVLASPGTTSTTWSLSWAPPSPGPYAIQVIAVDGVGKVDPSKPWVTFQAT